MNRKNWPKWLINKNLEKYDDVCFVGYQDGYFTVILENFDDQSGKKKLKLTWEHIYAYMEANESCREDVWLEEGDTHWPFYKLNNSPFISTFKSINTIYSDSNIYHFVIVGEEVIDILSEHEPMIDILDSHDQTVNEFSEINAGYVDQINGQTRFGYYLSDHENFFEIPDIIEYYGAYKGSIIKFYDFETGKVYTPFELEENVLYASPIYLDNSYYFLQADFTKKIVNIYSYYPEIYLDRIAEFKMEELNLYNLRLMGESLHLISHDEKLNLYYPYRKTINLEANESAMFIKEDKVYISAWIGEGWDDEKRMAGPNYEYYNKMIIKDMEGNTIDERKGELFQHIDGTWRLG